LGVASGHRLTRRRGRREIGAADGRSLAVTHSSSTWGAMSTAWTFVVDGDRVSRFETGQA